MKLRLQILRQPLGNSLTISTGQSNNSHSPGSPWDLIPHSAATDLARGPDRTAQTLWIVGITGVLKLDQLVLTLKQLELVGCIPSKIPEGSSTTALAVRAMAISGQSWLASHFKLEP
jgi:hypothetical protein